MKHFHKIQDRDGLYAFFRYYVDFSLRLAYREIKYIGKEKIPTDGAVIYAPNHTNALMDALVILALDKKQKVFVARADIFKNRKVARILAFLKIMPIMRIRDGMEEVRKNNETIEKSVDVLKDRVPFCILPEGTHRAKHSLLPLSKGIFRIAISAMEIMPDHMPLYIVPMGLEYGNYFRFRSSALIQVGDPINVGEYMKAHSGMTVPEIMNLMKEDLAERMKSVILYIPDDEYYDATRNICAAVFKTYPRRKTLMEKFTVNKEIIANLQQLRTAQPSVAEELFSKGSELDRLRYEKKISLNSVAMRRPFWSRILKTLILIVTLPYTVPATILTSPITALSAWLFSKMKDRAFFNSIRFVVTIVLWPVLLIIYAIVAYCTLPWEWALGITLALVPATIICQDAYRLLRLIVSDLCLLFSKQAQNLIRDIRILYSGSIHPGR